MAIFQSIFLKTTVLAWCLPRMSSKHGKFTRQKGCTWWLFQLFFGDVYRAYSRKTLTHHGFFQGRFVESATDPCLALHGWSSRRVPTLTTHPHSISVCKPKRRSNGIVSQGDLGHFWGGVLWVLSRALWVWWIDRQWLGLLRRQPIYIPLSFCVGIPKCESNAFERGISLKKWDLFDEFLFFFLQLFSKSAAKVQSAFHILPSTFDDMLKCHGNFGEKRSNLTWLIRNRGWTLCLIGLSNHPMWLNTTRLLKRYIRNKYIHIYTHL